MDASVKSKTTPIDSDRRASSTLSATERLRPGGSAVGIHHIHIAIPAGSKDVVLRFYRDLLGFDEIPVPSQLAHLAAAWLERGPVRVHLGIDPDFHPAKKAHPAFLVRGLDGLVRRLAAEGVASIPALVLHGYRRCHVFDPVGNRIELIEPAEGNPHTHPAVR